MARQSERLLSLMQRLRLLHLPACYEQLADTAAQKEQPYLEFLENVLEAESQAKFERNVRLKTLWANFPFQKRLDQGSAALLVERVKRQPTSPLALDLMRIRLDCEEAEGWHDHTFAASAS